MKVRNVYLPVFGATPIRKASESNYTSDCKKDLLQDKPAMSCPTMLVLAQRPNIKFTGNYKKDNLDEYENYKKTVIPDIEIKKYDISKEVQRHIENEDYLSAIKGKLKLAEICQLQKKENDAFYLEESIRTLYEELPKYQKREAKEAISRYNVDMAMYIDQDIEEDKY